MRPSNACATLRGATLAALAIGAFGCRAVRAVVATPEDHAAYVPTRTRPTLEERLHAAEAYLVDHPDGVFAADVRRAYLRGEEALWASKRGSVAGLESYLATLPRGPHAKVARKELDAKRAARVDLLGAGAARTEERLAAAAAARTRARDALGVWLRRFTDEALYEGTMAAAPTEIVVAWSLGLPQPRCTAKPDGGRSCRKLITETFEIPRAGEREVVLEIDVEEASSGRVCGVSMSGPALFARWEEAGSATGDRPEADQIIRDVEALVRSTIEARPGGSMCSLATQHGERDRSFACGLLRVDLGAADAPGGDDGIYISTASPCSSP